jgi:hypothetical protein
MKRLTDIIHEGSGGIFATSLSRGDLRQGFTQPGVVLIELDGEKIGSTNQLLVAFGEQLRVPDLAETEDWDYLDEALVDLDEFPTAPAFVILFDQFGHLAKAEPRRWETILRVFAHAVEEGRSRKKPMYIFLLGKGPSNGLPLVDKT